jgi:hypothetical protein
MGLGVWVGGRLHVSICKAFGSIPRTKKKKKNHLIILDSRYMHREGEGRGHREKKGPYTGY